MRRISFGMLVSTLLACSACVAPQQEDRIPTELIAWPQFRGPSGLAVAVDQTIPDDFGPDRRVLWKQPVESGHSSPCIAGDRIYMKGYEGTNLTVSCRSRGDGALVWKREFGMEDEEIFKHGDCSPAGPSPCTDGKRIYAYFGAYGLVALALHGEVVWEKKLPVVQNNFGTGSSPVLDRGSLYLLRDVYGFSSLTAYDTATGEEKWSTPRPEAEVSYATPFIWRRPDRTELVVAGTSVLKSYDASNGKALWWVSGITMFACTSPTASDDVLYYGSWSTGNVPPERRLESAFDATDAPVEAFRDPSAFIAHFDKNGDAKLQKEELPPSRARDGFDALDFNQSGAMELEEIEGFVNFQAAPGKNILVAVRGGGEGDITKTHVLWEKEKGIPYVASPLLYRDRLYYVKRGGLMTCIDARTGEPRYERSRLGVGGEYYSTPVAVGDRILVGAARGTMFVLAAGDELDIVARPDFGEGIYATPAVVDNTLYLRTADHLWAFSAAAP